MIFLDTPGWLKPKDAFQSSMKKSILRSLFDDADAIIWVVEPRELTAEEKTFTENLIKSGKPIGVAINKMDSIQGKEQIDQVIATVRGDLPEGFPVFSISAKGKQGLDKLKDFLREKMPESPPYFPTDQVTDRWERFYVTELIREQIFALFEQEVPHATAVVIEDFQEKAGRKDVIKASLYVETEGQKQILVGRHGSAIQQLGQKARLQIEEKLGRPVYLDLMVKIKKNWRDDPQFLAQLDDRNHF